MAQCEEVQKLFAVSARYHGPNSGRVSADADMSEEEIHEAILRKEYTDNKASTRKGDNTRLKRWYIHCQEKAFMDLHPYPATRVAIYLKVDLDRNINAGNKGIGNNVGDTLNSLRKLARIQGCPVFTAADISLMTAVINTAHQATQAKALQTPKDHDKSAQNRQTLTSADIENIFAVCAGAPGLLGARAQVLAQLEWQTGFRGCEAVHATYYGMQLQTPDQFSHIGPDAFKVIGIGINQGKTNKTGQMYWTGVAQHACAQYDALASLAELLSFEIHDNNCRLLDMMLDRDNRWDQVKIFFPGQCDKSLEQQVGQLRSLQHSVTKQIPDWDKDKQLHLWRKTAANQLNVHGAGHGPANSNLGCTQMSTVPLPSMSWLDAVIPRLIEALQLQHALPRRAQETLECLRLHAESYWQCLPIRGLKYGDSYLDRQVPGVQEVRKTAEYRQFAEQVIQKEADSLQRLGLKAPHLAPWTTSTSRTGSHTSAAETETSGSAETELRPAKRQRTQAETELQAQLDDLESQNKQAELKLKIQQQLVYQKALQLQMDEQTQAARTLAASQQVPTPMVWSLTQQPGQTTAALIAPPFLPHGVHATTAAGPVPLMEGSIEPPVDSKRMSEQPARTKAQLHNPDFFQSKTIAGRYSEWADDGNVSSIKSRLVPTNRGMGLPRAGHTRRATDNLRRNRNLPEAIDKLIERGLTRPAALELVTKVLSEFDGLDSISQQSLAFHELAHKSSGDAGTKLLGKRGKTVQDFELAFEREVERATNLLRPAT
ncbi:TPA: hypothetical protein ACH3X1_016624 [Trebouxia sp. C0004]